MTTSLVALLISFLLVENCGAYFDRDQADDQVLIVLSLDAFKPEYFDLGITRNMESFRREGSYSPYMIPRFPTKTFVNHFSLGTGEWRLFSHSDELAIISVIYCSSIYSNE